MEVKVFALFTVVVADGNVTLESLTIFTTHEWFGRKPDVYFRCQGEERVALPDVKAKGQVYKFLGEESWQVALEPCVLLETEDKSSSIKLFTSCQARTEWIFMTAD